MLQSTLIIFNLLHFSLYMEKLSDIQWLNKGLNLCIVSENFIAAALKNGYLYKILNFRHSKTQTSPTVYTYTKLKTYRTIGCDYYR